MNKLEVQKRVLQNGKPLDLDKFEWCEKTKTFSSEENDLVINFNNISGCTFTTDSDCTFDTGYGCTFSTGRRCTFKTGDHCTFRTSSGCTFDTYSGCTFTTGSYCTFNTYSGCTFTTGSDCTFDTKYDCTFKTNDNCIFKTRSDCTFNTDSDCTFDTGSDCTFDTGSDCTFTTYSGCTFTTGAGCVIVNRNVFEVILPSEGDIIQIFPYDIRGYLVNGLYNNEPHIIADGILSKILSKKGGVYKVRNFNKEEDVYEGESYLIERAVGNKKVYSHGKTLKEARESLIYKLSDRDTSKFKDLGLESTLDKEKAIECYMTITGACAYITKSFVDSQKDLPESMTIREIIELTKGQYGNGEFERFFIN